MYAREERPFTSTICSVKNDIPIPDPTDFDFTDLINDKIKVNEYNLILRSYCLINFSYIGFQKNI